MVNILPGPSIITVKCEPEGGDWNCFEQTEPEYCGVGYSCEESVYKSNIDNINLFCEYQDEYEQWDCPTLDLKELLETRCLPVTSVCGAGAEPLTVSSGASGSILLSAEFSSSCPAEKICYNERFKKCCSLIKLGRRYKCPKYCWYMIVFYTVLYVKLFTVQCKLYTVHFTLYTVQWTVTVNCTVHCILYTSYCILYTVLYSIQYLVCSIQYTVYSIQFTVYSIQYTVYSLQYTVYRIQYTVYSIQYTVYRIQDTVIIFNKIYVLHIYTNKNIVRIY